MLLELHRQSNRVLIASVVIASLVVASTAIVASALGLANIRRALMEWSSWQSVEVFGRGAE